MLENLRPIHERLKPNDIVLNSAWLFSHDPDLPDASIVDDFDTYQQKLSERRLAVVRQIAAEAGSAGIHRLVSLSVNTAEIGWAVGRESLLPIADIGMPRTIDSEDERVRNFVTAYVRGRCSADKEAFLRELPIATWTAEQVANFACLLPFSKPTWDWVGGVGPHVQAAYWSRCWGHIPNGQLSETRFATERLLEVNRAFFACSLLYHAVRSNAEVEVDEVFRVLEAGLERSADSDRTSARDPWAVQQLISFLQARDNVDANRLARLEWGYLPLLHRRSSRVGPKTLFKLLKIEAEFFVELIKAQYRAEDEEPSAEPLPASEQVRARNAHDLLDQFGDVPGVAQDGSVNEAELDNWLSRARDLATNCGRLRICDHLIGQLLSRFPKLEGLSWPHRTICGAMERIGSEELFRGFSLGIVNSRGVVGRSLTQGGDAERKLAEKYRQMAKDNRAEFPRLAQEFDGLVGRYEREAEEEDKDAERRRVNR
jgi:hypothetical protein